jgi:hypothetical protein
VAKETTEHHQLQTGKHIFCHIWKLYLIDQAGETVVVLDYLGNVMLNTCDGLLLESGQLAHLPEEYTVLWIHILGLRV